jgi:hypothetical protein
LGKQPEVASQLVGQTPLVPLQAKGAQLGDPSAPVGRTLQVPTEPAKSQASQAPVQAAWQQSPSAQ